MPRHVSVVFNQNRSFTYSPDANYRFDSFTFKTVAAPPIAASQPLPSR